jgi:hypothetical protein
MGDFIPFVSSLTDADVATAHYGDAECFRVSLYNAEELIPRLPNGARLWLDPGIDGYPDFKGHQKTGSANDEPKGNEQKSEKDDETRWLKYMQQQPWHECLADERFLAKPNQNTIDGIVSQLMDACVRFQPSALSVPQVAHTKDSARNAVNRQLAEGFAKWNKARNFDKLRILPAVFTSFNRVDLKTERDKKVTVLSACYEKANANGIWAADCDLADQRGVATFESKRFPGMLALHQELGRLPNLDFHCAGPYWGLNLVLWARGLTTHFACALGTGYRYYRAGQRMGTPTPRVAISPLRRWARANVEFWRWLDEVIGQFAEDDPVRVELEELKASRRQLELDRKSNKYKEHVARFYRGWFETIAALPARGRALALYQDLSSAHVVGARLPAIPSEEYRAQIPNVVARQLMLNCV